MARPHPQLVALLLCDRAFQEAGTGNWCIIGAFDTINSPKLPFKHPRFSVFVALSDFSGDGVVELAIRDEEGAIVAVVRGKIPKIPLGLFQYVFPFPEVEFPKTGVHTLELLAGGQLVTLRSFRVLSTAADPAEEQRQVEELFEQHKKELARDALEVWAQHPEARPIGLLASAQASESPWFRQAFGSVFGSPPPQLTFVGILDPETTRRLLGTHAAQAEEWLALPSDAENRVLPVLIVTKNGFQFVRHEIAGD